MKKEHDLGLGATKPKKTCEAVTCPWHGHLKIRGRIFKGEVIASKTKETCVIQWNYAKYIKKYERYERRKTKIAAHMPACMELQVGDIVMLGECQPISKSKKFVIFEKV